MDRGDSHLSGWKRLTKQSMEMLTMSGLQTQREARFPYSTHRGVAKFVLSAQLNPAHIGKSFILYGEGNLARQRIVCSYSLNLGCGGLYIYISVRAEVGR
jgi:hypothetical protein